ncbi:22.7 kDa class IV heat shock protein-like [Humulus lupulus]|uniref:22.7 kDa class IV heat shock protein-like n=1 Tax=Humulus lupulus TaxID=3486 RepID=UPI002B41835A|nr:22.7 kDa class IV heat shock protein-like [Humulus lupulus]
MAKLPIALLIVLIITVQSSTALVPYTGSLWDAMVNNIPSEDPFRILEHTPFSIPKASEPLALARADWKETATEHVIAVDVPGMKKEDVKIEVEENRVLRVSGEMKAEEEREGDKWHRSERISGKFWRRFRLPENADLDAIKAKLENGVLKVTVPKLAEEKKKKQSKVIDIVETRDEL